MSWPVKKRWNMTCWVQSSNISGFPTSLDHFANVMGRVRTGALSANSMIGVGDSWVDVSADGKRVSYANCWWMGMICLRLLLNSTWCVWAMVPVGINAERGNTLQGPKVTFWEVLQYFRVDSRFSISWLPPSVAMTSHIRV